ncbi:uncharacterized protein LOC126326042 [Schistocerca gregaria]|uniref:uncharacterized protein LOC126326042 n=1 Tax=Schistocerca gregaria TaxID=7010 RepID=UPI00211E2D84|nr:uncharacterized protein LOC126326042 [Schistocerca gregaria]
MNYANDQSLLVHHCRFVPFNASSIVDLAINEDQSLLAVARQSGLVEIWCINDDCYQNQVFYTHNFIRRVYFVWLKVSDSSSISQHGILTIGLDGYLRIYNINSYVQLYEVYVGCGPLWDMAWIPKTGPARKLESQYSDSELDCAFDSFSIRLPLALAGDDGSVRILNLPIWPDKSISSQPVSTTDLKQEQIILQGARSKVLCIAAIVFKEKHNSSVNVSKNSSLPDSTIWIWAGTQDSQLIRWDGRMCTKDGSITFLQSTPSLIIDLVKNVIPWSVLIPSPLSDKASDQLVHRLIVGDSEGQLTIWDGEMGTLIQTLKYHKADITRLAMDASQQKVYSVGVDNTIILYQKKTVELEQKSNENVQQCNSSWTYCATRRPHTHDILAIATDQKCLYTGGVDTKLSVCQIKDMLRLPGRTHLPFRQQGHAIATLVLEGRMSKDDSSKNPLRALAGSDKLLVMLDKRIQIWQLSKASCREVKSNEHQQTKKRKFNAIIDTLEEHKLLLELKFRIQGPILCHAVENQIRRLAISDSACTKVFYIERSQIEQSLLLPQAYQQSQVLMENTSNGYDKQNIFEVKKKVILENDGSMSSSTQLVFASNGILICAITPSFVIQLWDTASDDLKPQLVHTFTEHSVPPSFMHASSFHTDIWIPKPIHSLALSSSNKYLASADLNHRLFVYSLSSYQLIWALPVFDSHITCMAFDPTEAFLVVSLVSNQIYVYSLENRALSDWSQNNINPVPATVTTAREKIAGILFHRHLMLLYGHSFIAYTRVNFYGKKSVAVQQKDSWRVVKKYQPLFVGFTQDGALVIVERPWMKMLQDLPPSFYRQRYAT